MNHFPTSSTTTCSTIESSKEIIKIRKKRSSSSSSSSSSCGHKIKGVMRLSTDPQSVAARERRHRISDRFKILQSLVPGGSKMDTVSMLEEAIHYVKFLKAQIWLHQNLIMINNNSHQHQHQHHHHDHDDDHGRTMFFTPPDHHHGQISTISATTLYEVPAAQVVQPEAVMAHDDQYYFHNSFQTPETTSFDSISYVKF